MEFLHVVLEIFLCGVLGGPLLDPAWIKQLGLGNDRND
jgi:hypothetical protein